MENHGIECLCKRQYGDEIKIQVAVDSGWPMKHYIQSVLDVLTILHRQARAQGNFVEVARLMDNPELASIPKESLEDVIAHLKRVHTIYSPTPTTLGVVHVR